MRPVGTGTTICLMPQGHTQLGVTREEPIFCRGNARHSLRVAPSEVSFGGSHARPWPLQLEGRTSSPRAVQACGDTGCGGLTVRRPGQGAGVRKVLAYFPDCQSLRTSFCPPGAFRKHTLWASPQALPLSGTFVLETPGSGPGSSSLFIYSPLRVLTPFLNSVC